MEVTAHVELVAQRVYSKDNVHVVKFTNITLDETEYDRVFSDSFYNERGGYKLRLQVCPNKCNHVAVYLCLMPGLNDDTLQFPMRGKFTITLLNQIEDRNHCECVVTACQRSDEVFNRKHTNDSLMSGLNDDSVEWPLQGKFSMMLLNQLQDNCHHVMSVSFNDKTPSNIAQL